jgi:AAA family ATP:ADP antiporter
MANVLLLLVAYYVLKTVREPLILASGGAQLKAYATSVQAVLLIGFVPAYSALTKRLKRMQLITATLLFYAAVFVLFWVFAKIGVPYLGFAFFLVLGIFSLSAIAQFWSLANDLYTKEQGKRLFAILGIGASLGAVVGSFVASKLVEPLGPFPMMIVASVILGICLALSWTANAREADRAKASAAPPADDKPIGGKNGFALILEDRYLLLVAIVILLLNLVNTTGELIMSERVTQEAAASVPDFASLPKDAQKEIIGKFAGRWYGEFFTWVNAIGAVAQLFVVSRVFKYLGIRAALFSLPLIGLFTYGTFAFIGTFALVRAGKIAENATDYSLYNTTKQALWLPTTREQKYNAKMAIDTFIVRVGDLVSGLFVGWGLKIGMAVERIAMVNLGIIVVWLAVVVLVGRENHKRMADEDAPVPAKS